MHANLPSYLVNSSAIKPSNSFLSPERDNVKFTAFVDLMDGPSSLQKRSNIPTLYEKDQASSIYEAERS